MTEGKAGERRFFQLSCLESVKLTVELKACLLRLVQKTSVQLNGKVRYPID